MLDKKTMKKLLKKQKEEQKKIDNELKEHIKSVKKICKEFKEMLKILGKKTVKYKLDEKDDFSNGNFEYYTNYNIHSREILDKDLATAQVQLYKEFKEKTGIDPNPSKVVESKVCSCGEEIRGQYCYKCGKDLKKKTIRDTSRDVKIATEGIVNVKNNDGSIIAINLGTMTVASYNKNLAYGTPVKIVDGMVYKLDEGPIKEVSTKKICDNCRNNTTNTSICYSCKDHNEYEPIN